MAAVVARELTSPPPTPIAMIAWRLRAETGLRVMGGPWLEVLSGGWADAQKGEATTGIAIIRDGFGRVRGDRHPRTQHHSTSPCWPRRWRLPGEKSRKASPPSTTHRHKRPPPARRAGTQKFIARAGELTGRLPYPDPAKAEDSTRMALAIAREQGTRGYEWRAATSLARLRRDTAAGPKRATCSRLFLRLVHRGLRHARPSKWHLLCWTS